MEPLQPLRERPLPPEKDDWHPGYPNFINGEFGQQPLQPPLGILDANGENVIEPTPLEEANFAPDFAPGALYTMVCLAPSSLSRPEQNIIARSRHLKHLPVIHKIFDSKVHGDPVPPLLKAYTKERVIVRYLMPADKPRNIGFLIHGHEWRSQPEDPLSHVEAAKGAISVGNVYDLELLGGATISTVPALCAGTWDPVCGGSCGSSPVPCSILAPMHAVLRESGGKKHGIVSKRSLCFTVRS